MRWIHRVFGLLLLLVLTALVSVPRGVAAAPGDKPAEKPKDAPKDKDGAKDAPALAAADLRPRFVAGRKSRFEIWTLRKDVTTMSGFDGAPAEPVKSSLELRGEVTWTVEKVRGDGGATCILTIDWLTADSTDGDGDVEHVDTRKARPTEDSEGYDTLKTMTGVPLRFEVSPLGTIEKVTGVDAMKKSAPEGIHVPDELDFIETASDLATLPGAPDAELAPGKGWDIPFDWSHELGTIHHQMHYTLGGLEQIASIPVATVTGHSTQKLEVDKTKLGEGAPSFDARLTAGATDTQVMWDLQRHEAVGRNTVESRTIEMKIKLGETTLSRTVSETVQGQALRISEE